MSTLVRALLAQIEAATGAGDFGAVRRALARSTIGVMEVEFEAGEAGLIFRASREANKAIYDTRRRMELIARAGKAGETRRCADQVRVALALDQLKRLDDRNWTTQLLAAGSTQKGRVRKGGK